ncbi:hypothetical protein AB4Z25_11685 [Rhizobium sp. RAF36]|uniref:hypothetical protein n=1 Tax=Rhizobium sp. RAF36 TaxID=3233055 RepID=UPI003F9AB434
MSLVDFLDDPWGKSHELYSSATLAISPAPEYASSEVILSSVYRVIGIEGAQERTVPLRGRELDRLLKRARERSRKPEGATLEADAFENLLGSVLESPKLPNQSTKRFLQVTPLVPQVAIFSGSARLAGNPWTPGQLIRRMIWLGSPSAASARSTWQALFDALSVTEDDDVFARFLQAELKCWFPEPSWHLLDLPDTKSLSLEDAKVAIFPARQMVLDLKAVIAAKPMMTRRQWTSLLESILRLASVAHVVWLCEVHGRIWQALASALDGAGPTDEGSARVAMYPDRFACLPYGNKALPSIRDTVSQYLAARLSINAVLWGLDSLGIKPSDGLSSAAGLASLCEEVRVNRGGLAGLSIREATSSLLDKETRVLLCRRGIGSNINEFARHALGKRQTANQSLRTYDQGFFLKKSGTSTNSPWIVSLGPVAVLTLVHCALSGVAGPRSVHRLAQHLGQYGVTVDHGDIPHNDLGSQLRMLGLVLDSPDAESGMLLLPPFGTQNPGGTPR